MVVDIVYPFEYNPKAVEQNKYTRESNSRPCEPKSQQIEADSSNGRSRAWWLVKPVSI